MHNMCSHPRSGTTSIFYHLRHQPQVGAMRMRALQLICKAYLPHFPASDLQSVLAFKDLKECTEWVGKVGGVVATKTVKVGGKPQTMQVVNTKPSYRVIANKKTGWGSGLL